MAERKGTTPDVKAFGARMVRDHAKALDELEAAAHRAGLAVPTTLQPAQQQLKEQLGGLTGTEFNDTYMKHMVAGHGDAIEVFAQEIANGASEPLRAYAERTMATLEAHEKAATEDENNLRQQRR